MAVNHDNEQKETASPGYNCGSYAGCTALQVMYCVIALGSIVPLMKVLLCCNHFFYHDSLLFMKEQGRTFIPGEILHQRCWFNIGFGNMVAEGSPMNI